MSARETHVTEWGLGVCTGLQIPIHKSTGLRMDTVACMGMELCNTDLSYPSDVLFSEDAAVQVPTCPRCAVLRDEALEGRLPKR